MPAACPSADEDIYDLAPEPTVRRAAASSQPGTGSPPQAIPAARVLSYQRGPVSNAGDPYFPNPITDFYMPLALLCGGIAVEFAAGWWARSDWGIGPRSALTDVGARLIFGTAMMMLAVFAAARRRGFRFGPFWGAVLKLSAVSVAPAAAMTLLNIPLQYIPLGGLITWIAGFCFYFALLGVFFELDQPDTWYCVMIIFLVQLAVWLGVIYLL